MSTVHEFSLIPKIDIQRSFFDRSHRHMTSINAGLLYPVFLDEVLPSDTFTMRTKAFGRMATQICPSMGNVTLDIHYFYIPTRLVWANFKKFMGEQARPGDSTDYLVPQVTVANSNFFTNGSLDGAKWDAALAQYFGLPPAQNPETGAIDPTYSYSVNALPFRCYNLIWNEWFRDQNLQDPKGFTTTEAVANASAFTLLPRNKRHDYFSSALPWPQKGETDYVNVSLGDTAPVVGNGLSLGLTSDGTNGLGIAAKGGNPEIGALTELFGKPVGSTTGSTSTASGALGVTSEEDKSGLVAKLSLATPISINALRQAFQIQRWMEQSARGGSRYIETVKTFFGCDIPDLRVQRPEFLGGDSFKIISSTVPQTSASTETTPQGNLAAYSVFSGTSRTWSKTFTEHGYIIGLASIRSDLDYQQGVNRMWLRKSKFDFYWPTFAHLGEQSILNKEIFVTDDSLKDGTFENLSVNEKTFGYQERYAEYRYKPNLITGRLNSLAPQSLDVWHFGQKFANLPTLSDAFIRENPPIQRNLAVQSGEPQFICDFFFDLKCARPMPVYGVPGLIDHY